MTQNTKTRCYLNNTEALKKALIDWWQGMMLPNDVLVQKGIPKASSGTRARLQRCESVNAILINTDFQSLWQRLPDSFRDQARAEDIECWAVIAGVVVFVRNDNSIEFACAAGTKDKKTDKPTVSEMRFARLQAARTPDDLLLSLRRTLKQLKQQVSVEKLSEHIEQWFMEFYHPHPRKADQRIRVKWAMAYFQAAGK